MSAFECDENTAILIDSVSKFEYHPYLYDATENPLERMLRNPRYPKQSNLLSSQLLIQVEPLHNGEL